MIPKKVVLMGIGKRARNVILPSLARAKDSFGLYAVVGRSERTELYNGESLQVRTTLTESEWQETALVILAVPKNEVGNALRKIPSECRKNIVLLLDTPVIPLKRLGLLRTLKEFKAAFVSEDSIGLPFWQEAQTILERGAHGTYGAPQKVEFFQSGYRYHALSAIKNIFGVHAFWYIRMRRHERFIKLPHGMAYMLEPRDYAIGHTVITCEKGTLSDEISMQGLEKHFMLPIVRGNEEMDAAKIEGCVRILHAVFQETSPYHYLPIDGVYDYLACSLSERTGWFFDVPLTGRQSVVKIIISALSFVLPR